MSDAMSVSPVRFVSTEAVSAYPRKNIRLGDVPVGHVVQCGGYARYIVTWWDRSKDEVPLLTASWGILFSHWGDIVTDHGPVDQLINNGKGGWDHSMSPLPTAPKVQLKDAGMMQVVRFPDGEVGVRLFETTENKSLSAGHTPPPGVLVAFDVGLRRVFGDALVTPLGSIKIGVTNE
jgi:hypothetical protein